MNYKDVLVVDVEATCWRGYPPKGQTNEIIEIGICRLNLETLKAEAKRSILVQPARSEISEFCTELTTLTQKQIDSEGISFKQACRILEDEYDSRRLVWGSYGDYDRDIFRRNCRDLGVHYPFSKRHINIKLLFALAKRLNREVGMKRAVGLLGETLEGTHHRGHDDAWNTAKILAYCLKQP